MRCRLRAAVDHIAASESSQTKCALTFVPLAGLRGCVERSAPTTVVDAERQRLRE
jgi:hypothetical protein